MLIRLILVKRLETVWFRPFDRAGAGKLQAKVKLFFKINFRAGVTLEGRLGSSR
jgi:hypothetical protein